ncbi:MAG: UDP-N-acetylmuramate dehydrogenase [Polyangiaceae bacterium]|nr:UDP-N-acetylmuramate dehydrogenase [Polyangiaceae bacterium]
MRSTRAAASVKVIRSVSFGWEVSEGAAWRRAPGRGRAPRALESATSAGSEPARGRRPTTRPAPAEVPGRRANHAPPRRAGCAGVRSGPWTPLACSRSSRPPRRDSASRCAPRRSSAPRAAARAGCAAGRSSCSTLRRAQSSAPPRSERRSRASTSRRSTSRRARAPSWSAAARARAAAGGRPRRRQRRRPSAGRSDRNRGCAPAAGARAEPPRAATRRQLVLGAGARRYGGRVTRVLEHVPLAPRTTLGVGGPARWLVRCAREADVLAAAELAHARGVPLLVLAGGSNLVVADEGVDAVVVSLELRGATFTDEADTARLDAGAGEPWDGVVAAAAQRGAAGIECLSGIPGLAGATPVQNVGAYGQEVSQTIERVRAIDPSTGAVHELHAEACGFGYRDSRFKREPGRLVVTSVRFRLPRRAPEAPSYAELARALGGRAAAPTLLDVREAVKELRRQKSMLAGGADENSRSCGSFFTNPVVDLATLATVESRAADPSLPRHPQPDGRVKLPAAWLIERAGLPRGARDGAVGLSTRHTLALVAHEGATAREVVRFARRVRATVEDRFGVRLVPEPVFWGFGSLDDGLPVG